MSGAGSPDIERSDVGIGHNSLQAGVCEFEARGNIQSREVGAGSRSSQHCCVGETGTAVNIECSDLCAPGRYSLNPRICQFETDLDIERREVRAVGRYSDQGRVCQLGTASNTRLVRNLQFSQTTVYMASVREMAPLTWRL